MARQYASAGVPVFPCTVDQKTPATKHGFKDATTDLAQIDAWWSAAPYNIGYVPESIGCALVDVDPKNGGRIDDVPGGSDGFPIETPSTGTHLLFAGSIAASAGKIAPGIDTRGRLSYALAPGSVVGGREYRASHFPPEAWDLAPLPQEIVGRVEPRHVTPREAKPYASTDTPAAIAEARRYLAGKTMPIDGEGSDFYCYKVAAHLKRDLALSIETGAGLMNEWAPHFDREWLEDKLRNADRYAQNEEGSDVPPPAETVVQLVRGMGGRPMRVNWLWREWLPRGMLTIFGGEKGVGKSTVTYAALATITRGGQWPDGSQCPAGDVLIWSAEDDWYVTILPRLIVAGADFDRVYHVGGVFAPGGKRQFDPASDMQKLLEATARIPNLCAMLIDPVVSAVSGDSHKNAETRRGLQPLVDFAGERQCAVIGITHFSKNTQRNAPLDRINGSLAFSAIARMVWGAVKSEDESAVRRLVRVASNIGPMGGAFDYTLHQRPVSGEDFTAQGVQWGAFNEGDARSLIADVQGEERTGRLKEAEDFLAGQLAGGALVEVDEIKRAAKAHDISEATLLRAKRKLHIAAEQREGGRRAAWCWRLLPQSVD